MGGWTDARGEKNGSAKLSDDDVRYIREAFFELRGKALVAAVKEQFGIEMHASHLRDILEGKARPLALPKGHRQVWRCQRCRAQIVSEADGFTPVPSVIGCRVDPDCWGIMRAHSGKHVNSARAKLEKPSTHLWRRGRLDPI